MIEVKMDLIPYGVGTPRTLVTVEIINDGTGTPAIGNYTWEIRGKHNQCIRQGDLTGWPRQQKSPGELLAKVMALAYPRISA